MPTISRFYGLAVKMYFKEWIKKYEAELLEAWNTQTIKELPPLE
jgi:hypothetical protein